MIQEVRRGGLLRPGAGIVARQFGHGRTIARINEFERTWIKLTGTYSAGYPWKEVVRSGGAWVDTGRTGSSAADPAFELNDDTTLTSGNTVYWAQRSVFSGDWVFYKLDAESPPEDPFETGDCFCPGGIGGLPSAIVPSVLYYTATWYHPDGVTVLGVTTGSIAYVNPLLIPDATGVTYCPIGGSGVFGWYGPLQRYQYIIDDELTGAYHAEFREACNTDDFFIDPDAPIDPVLCCNGLWISCNYLSGVLGEEGHFGIFSSCDVPDLPDFLCSSAGAGTFTAECDPIVFTIEQTVYESPYGTGVTIVITP